MKDIIENLKLEPMHRHVYDKMADLFQKHIPDSLFMDYQELHQLNPDISTRLWEDFLDHPEIDIYVNKQVAKYMRINARKSLQKLTDPDTDLKSHDVQAIKEIIDKSKILDQKMNPKQHIITHHVPTPN